MARLFSRLFSQARGEAGKTFRSLRHRNYMLYSSGQLISLTGTWMQNVALSWITYQMTGSAFLLGLVGVFTNLPVLCLSLLGGMVADKYDRRRVLIVTQWVELALAGVLTALAWTGCLQVWMILAIAAGMGTASAFEFPCRQAVLPQLVGGEDVVNAISINSVIFNTTRMIGPAIGALLLATFGGAVCFGLNALSYLGAILTLHALRLQSNVQSKDKKKPSSIREGLQLAWAHRQTRDLFVLTFFISFFGFQFSVLMPVFVKDVFHGSPTMLGFLSAATALGSLGGSLLLASRGKAEGLKRTIRIAAVGVFCSLLLFALSNSVMLTAAIVVLVGACYSMQLNSTNSLLQLSLTDDVRGRVMSMYTMILLGAVPFGSLTIGRLADAVGAPWAVATCATACGISALYYLRRSRKD